MEYFEKRETLPLGRGKEFSREREKMKMPAVEVRNMVMWVNPAFPDAPFGLKEGEPSRLGMFFTPNKEAHPGNDVRFLSVLPEIERSRSGTVGSVIFKDREGRLYRDVDIKGSGHIEYTMGRPSRVRSVERNTAYEDASGVFDEYDALNDRDFTEKLLAAGIRTHRVLAIITLEEVINDKGEKISIARAKKEGMLPQDASPVISVRAFGTKERIRGLDPFFTDNNGIKRQEESLFDALHIIAGELGKNPEWFSLQAYLEWFAKTLGANVAKIHKMGLCHGFLSSHNITLDCNMTDFDSMQTIEEAVKEKIARGGSPKKEYIYEEDREDAEYTLCHLLNFIQVLKEESSVMAESARKLPSEDQLALLFKESYNKELLRSSSSL